MLRPICPIRAADRSAILSGSDLASHTESLAMFKLALTNPKPNSPENLQRGFSAVGSGAQYTPTDAAPWFPGSQPLATPWTPLRPTKGKRSFFPQAAGASAQRGMPAPENQCQARPAGSMPNRPPVYGEAIEVYTDYYSRGAAAFVQNYGKILTNPIGAGIAVNHRPSASYGQSAQFVNGSIWWTSQAVPTSVGLQGLTSPQVLAALLGRMSVEAVVRVE